MRAKKSFDVDGDELEYKWQVKRGKAFLIKSKSSSTIFVLPRKPDKLVIELQVNDGTVNSKVVEKTITIKKRKNYRTE